MLVIELKMAGFTVEALKSKTVFFSGEVVGKVVANMVVEDALIVELKSVRKILMISEIQVAI